MGNQLTVANATSSDIYAYGSVIEFDVQKVSADVGLKRNVDATVTFGDEEVKLGWIAVAPSKKWTFPKLTFSRYYLTVLRKDSKDLISSGLQIPWRTNVIVTPDYKLAVAKSGKVWIDESDGTDYSPKKRNRQSAKSNGSLPPGDHDCVDGPIKPIVEQPLAAACPSSSTVDALRESTNVPEFVARLFASHSYAHGETDSNVIRTQLEEFVTLLTVQLKTCASEQDDLGALLSDLLRQEPIDMTPKEVDHIVGYLAEDHLQREELINFLHRADGCFNDGLCLIVGSLTVG